MGWVAEMGMGLAAGTPQSPRDLSDTTEVKEAQVWALRIPTVESRTAGSITRLNAETLQNGFSPDLQDVLNSQPGVSMDTRGAGGSRRLQIRNSGLRSPFGVRNIQLLLDGFILTNASGNSPLELVNPQWIHTLEVLRGPTGALVGNSYGGALIGRSIPTLAQASSHLRSYARVASTGGNEASRVSTESGFSLTQRSASNALTVRANWTQNPGYRLQEANARNTAEAHLQSSPSAGVNRHLWLGWYGGSWQLPGSLKESDALTSPESAPGANYNAHVSRSRTWVGWSTSRSTGTVQSGLWAYGQISDKLNPFGTSAFYNGIKTENEAFASLRYWRAQSWPFRKSGKITWDQSAIFLSEFLDLKETDYRIDASNAPLRYSIQTGVNKLWASTGVRMEWDNQWQMDAQLSLEGVDRQSEGESRTTDAELKPYEASFRELNLLPFVQVSRQLGLSSRVFLQYARGGSQPTSFELVDPESFELSNLRSEQAHAFEAGARWRHNSRRTNAGATLQLYHQLVQNAIAQVPGEADGLFLSNVDGLTMSGMEFTGNLAHSFTDQFRLTIRVWGALNRHAFDPFATVVPGTPLHTAGTAGRLGFNQLALGWQHEWLDRIKLHNTQDDWADAHHRTLVFVQHESRGQQWQLGMRNPLNLTYSSWLQTNAFGGKYFNPAPGRTMWMSWRWSFGL